MTDTIDTVLEDIKTLPFMWRKRVFDLVQDRVSRRTSTGSRVAWPDVLLFATADDFRNALLTMQGQHNTARGPRKEARGE